MEKYQEQISIKSYHTNQYGQASISSLFNILIEAAWAHAQVMDWGYDSLKSNNLFWVLSRMYFQVEKYPSWQDEITLNTWSAGTDGMYAYREYIVENDKGEVILRASSAWLILDMETRKIFRLNDFRDTFPKRIDANACRAPKRIKPDAHSETLNYYPVLFSELDINQHFNSVKYVERVLDDFGIDFLNAHEPAELEVNYLKEGQAGDWIAVTNTKLSESESLNCLVRQSDGADLCVMRIVWRERVNC
ncbi:acyl-ACP thioesterase [Aquipluma nitroreducens]|uniref:Acyl-ACP thioesterase n=1 Tax=Aquipluma nitroreducens TaxID=2010828 RepID=A0A5K7SE57_9BACT|nr:acyl-ACP thioesterase domain-containing protein [Aquipluma nitroreducens]BBE19746.1 acyl-ACP thioesterase [Aquipluma nitroreducens]